MKSGYNEVKLKILKEIEGLGEATIVEVNDNLGRNYANTAMAMLRYHRSGLLSRHGVNQKNKIYSLSDRGRERLDWLLEQNIKDSDDEEDLV